MRRQNTEELRTKKLCYHCVDEACLSDEIKKSGKRGKCSYCGELAKSQFLDVLSERIGEVFQEHYVRTSDQPTDFEYSLLADGESDYDWQREGERITEAIMDAACIPQEAASDIQQLLGAEHAYFDADHIGEESEFSSESYYVEKDISDDFWHRQWLDFEKSIKAESRYFNRFAMDHLSKVFEGIDHLRARDNRQLVIEAGPGTNNSAFYRARAFQSDDGLTIALKRPDLHLGPPPSRLATAGRMNARGISVFYGANDPDVALAEVRPPVGSQVAVARFEITRPIHLLDLTALGEVVSRGSIFDPAYSRELERASFLRSLSQRITKAVMPDDEAFDYIATQAVSDFLAANAKTPVDGILFPSAQTGRQAQNVVLFHKASRVEAMTFLPGTEIDVSLYAWTDEGAEPEYPVIEKVRPKKGNRIIQAPAGGGSDHHSINCDILEDSGRDGRDVTLRLVPDSVRVHIVNEVKFKADEFAVTRVLLTEKDTHKY